MIAIIATALYILGYILSFCMLRIEQESEKEQYTKGDRVATIVFSLFSYLTILVVLIITWVSKIKKTGYWDRPVKDEPLNEIDLE
jgi:hypothetical protein